LRFVVLMLSFNYGNFRTDPVCSASHGADGAREVQGKDGGCRFLLLGEWKSCEI
jgi:hypothetical protein